MVNVSPRTVRPSLDSSVVRPVTTSVEVVVAEVVSAAVASADPLFPAIPSMWRTFVTPISPIY